MRLANLSTRSKVLAAFGVLVLFNALVGGVVVWNVLGLKRSVAELEAASRAVEAVGRLKNDLNGAHRAVLGFIVSGDRSYAEDFEQRWAAFDADAAGSESAVVAIAADAPAATEALAGVFDLATQWHGEIAAEQIRLMRDPFTVDMARALETTARNDRLWSDIADRLDALTAEIRRMGETRTAAQRAVLDVTQSAALAGAVLILLMAVAAGFLLVRSVARPIADLARVTAQLARRDWSVPLADDGRRDEIGAMYKALAVFKENGVEGERLAEEQREQERRQRAQLERQTEITREFDASIGALLQVVSEAAGRMRTTAQSLSATAAQTTDQSTAVAAASQEASANVQTVAAAAQELTNAIAEISGQVTSSSQIAQGAVAEAEDADRAMTRLNEAANRIGEVVRLISEIAEQTNLLALNATIEAARAGEAGKGFAVVASEVKNLANQTAKATEEIAQQIGDMQSATGGAVGKIKEIAVTIGKLNEISTSIASAIEEQSAATQEIARNVDQASAGTAEVDRNITGVSTAAGETDASARQVLEAAVEVTDQAERMRREIQGFLERIKAA